MKTLCLNMIVKNESKIIQRCLSSIKGTIDYWVIVDTGSTDGTQDLIRNFMRGIPGELHERPWVNFAHNRNEALNLARNKADYLLFVDADDEMRFLKEFDKNYLTKDFYMIMTRRKSGDLHLPSIISNDRGWFWDGVLHEHITHTRKMEGEILETAVNESYAQDGNRSEDPEKYLKDAKILEKELEKYPDDPRLLSYLAQSYEAAGELEKALELYEQRAAMEGDPQETFGTYCSIARIQYHLKKSSDDIIFSYCQAWQLVPLRAEPLVSLAEYFAHKNCHALAYVLSKFASEMRMPNIMNANFLAWAYEFGALALYADSAFKLQKYEEAQEAYRELLQRKIPQDLKRQAEKQLKKIPHPSQWTDPDLHKKAPQSKR